MKEIDRIKKCHKTELIQLEKLRLHYIPIDKNLAAIAEEDRLIALEEEVRLFLFCEIKYVFTLLFI